MDGKDAAYIEEMLDRIRKQIAPDFSILTIVDEVIATINTALCIDNIKAECVAGGSTAKRTFLKDDHDVDLFIRFDQSQKEEDISSMTAVFLDRLKIRGVKSIQRIHGSRDYFQFEQNSIHKKKKQIIHYEIVPVLKIHPSAYHEAENVTDFSPEHVAWVNSYTTKNPKLCDDIRLAKQFCKAQNVYGAESYINGFSGHILDILIIHYGSFLTMTRAFAEKTTKHPIIIDQERQLKNPLKELNTSKITPLIIIDPIQKKRNAAAAVSKEKLQAFIDACKKFMITPAETFFVITPFSLEKKIREDSSIIRKNHPLIHQIQIITLTIKTLEGSKDIVGTKVLKVYEFLITQLRAQDFTVLASGWNFTHEKHHAQTYFIVDNAARSLLTEQRGPPLRIRAEYEKFVAKHRAQGEEIKIRGMQVYALVKRKYMRAEDVLRVLIKESSVQTRIQAITIKKIIKKKI